jgi:HAD superfamily hydrolase (TIGR01662 family)
MLNIPKDLKLVIFDFDDTLHSSRYFSLTLDIKQVDILDYLYNHGVKLAIASNNAFARFILYEHGVLHKFVHVEERKFDDECATDKERDLYKKGTKNHMYKKILKKFSDINPSNVLVIDDFFLHISTAKRMGMKAIQVNPLKLVDWSILKKGFTQFNENRRRMSCDF